MERTHIIPIGKTEPIHHANGHCWCHPVVAADEPRLVTHNAQDCRERFERQNMHVPGAAWALIYESETPLMDRLVTEYHTKRPGCPCRRCQA